MKHFCWLFLVLSYTSILEAKTLVLECEDRLELISKVIIDTNAGFISMDGWLIKDDFVYFKESGFITAWGVIKEYGNDADFRHIQYIEKTKVLAWSDSFFRPRGVFGDNPPHKYVSPGSFKILKCKE